MSTAWSPSSWRDLPAEQQPEWPDAHALEQFAPMFGLTADILGQIPIAMVGTVDEVCEQLVERRARWGFNYVVIHEGEMDAFAPVVARLSGA